VGQSDLSAGTFHSLFDVFDRLRARTPDAGTTATGSAETLRRELRAPIHHQVSDAHWGALTQPMREAAEEGQKDHRLLRFPCADCTDDGRAIRENELHWPPTQTHEAAGLYRHWEQS
jgi:hypothetical protein